MQGEWVGRERHHLESSIVAWRKSARFDARQLAASCACTAPLVARYWSATGVTLATRSLGQMALPQGPARPFSLPRHHSPDQGNYLMDLVLSSAAPHPRRLHLLLPREQARLLARLPLPAESSSHRVGLQYLVDIIVSKALRCYLAV